MGLANVRSECGSTNSFIDYGLLAQPHFSGPLPVDEFGTIAPARMLELQRKALRLFFDATLNGKSANRLYELVDSEQVKVTARLGDQWAEPPQNTSLHLGMSDGVRIAVDLWLPADASAANRYPTLIRATRYWRDQGVTNPAYRSQTGPAQEAIGWASLGFAVLYVDARGSGASFGTRAHPWSLQEVKDYAEIVNWVVQQPWSDGKLGAYGISYEGNTAALIGMLGNPAVKAVSPQYGDMDIMTDIAAPGGVLNAGFLSAWMKNNRDLDNNDLCGAFGLNEVECSETRQVVTGVKPVDSDTDQSLLRAAVSEHPAGVEPVDNYSVDYTTTTGMTNRWWTQMGGGDVVYPDRAAEDTKLLVYETSPLERDLLVTGTPELTLQIASTLDDGAVFAYLEDVAPDGKVTYVTEGQLRLRYRAISTPAPEGQLGPYHSFRRADGAPMVPGVSEPIRIGLEPTSVLFRAGHRIRLAIAGHDSSCFQRVPAQGHPVWTITHQSTQMSALELPVMPATTP